MFSELFYWTLFEYLPPSTGTYLFISYLMKAHSILCPRPLSPAFPSSPCSEWNQAACAFKGGLYLLRTPPAMHVSRLICMWTLTGSGYEMWTWQVCLEFACKRVWACMRVHMHMGIMVRNWAWICVSSGMYVCERACAFVCAWVSECVLLMQSLARHIANWKSFTWWHVYMMAVLAYVRG